ncbi:MAG: peptidase [Sphingomonas bacterium]|uniref:M48 family metallopeptidase n=1 Tax=Sphingomonas bacterium TaxID=1895847 RepID=UPI00261B7251|nr:M48 family metallopeptidase [Sphingomonas bacterium]MDB5697083.1 peptidase [Sphingomonas bacterium]
MRPTIALAALALAAPAWAADKVKPAPPPPPYAGVYQPRGVDEIGWWREDDESERTLANSPKVIRDEALTGYVKSVLCAAVGADRCKATRVYIMREPSFNATMSPNGTMRVYSGLLLRVQSEAELAFVLGHEFGHFESRHTLQRFKQARSSTDLLAWAQVLASMNSYAATNFNSLQLSVYGGFYRFNRENEREADLVGLGYMNASTLRPQAASRVWRSRIAEAEASASMRGLKKPRFDRIAYFASHPPEAERATYLAALANPDGDGRDEGGDRYALATAKWMPIFLDDQVKLNDFGASEYIIGALAERGWTATLWHARGELFRMRGAQRDLVNAADFYSKAVALDPSHAEAQRGLGLSLIKTGRTGEGRAALESYLALQPAASDAAMITMTIAATGGK